jgi:SAM-dependent methyltransferase
LVTQAENRDLQLSAVVPQQRLLRAFTNPETVLLEIGHGDCALAFSMAGEVKQVYAVDISTGLVGDIIRPQNFELRLSDGIDIPLPANSVDVAYSNQLMEHLHPEDAGDQLRNISRVLKPGGFYICVTPNRLTGPHDISRHFDIVATGLHLREYTITELAQAFKMSGFSDVRIIASYHGHIFSPKLPVTPFAWIERLLEKSPRAIVKKAAHLLTAVKVIATK